MESFNEYIKGFGSGVKSLLIGMRTSMKVFWQPKVTEQYPETATQRFTFRNAIVPCSSCRTTVKTIITA